jgi:hypothetical protein
MARSYALAARPVFLTASLLAVITGTSHGWPPPAVLIQPPCCLHC